MKRTMLIAAVGAVLMAASPAHAGDGVHLTPASAAGTVDVPVAASAGPFTAKAAARSVRRALRAHGYRRSTVDCTRSGGRAAACTVTTRSGGSWTGTADVSRAKRVDRVQYSVVGS